MVQVAGACVPDNQSPHIAFDLQQGCRTGAVVDAHASKERASLSGFYFVRRFTLHNGDSLPLDCPAKHFSTCLDRLQLKMSTQRRVAALTRHLTSASPELEGFDPVPAVTDVVGSLDAAFEPRSLYE